MKKIDILTLEVVRMLLVAKQALFAVAIFPFVVALSSAQDNPDALTARTRHDLAHLQFQLNDTYIQSVQAAKLHRTPADVQNIKDSESKWRAYRDAECKAEYPLSAVEEGSCLVNMTRQRIAALKISYLKER